MLIPQNCIAISTKHLIWIDMGKLIWGNNIKQWTEEMQGRGVASAGLTRNVPCLYRWDSWN